MPKKVTLADRERRADGAGFRLDKHPRNARQVLKRLNGRTLEGIPQDSSIDTFLKHYLDRNITADVLSIYRGLKPQKALMRLASSMSRSIDPRRPWKLTPAQSRSVNDLPHIMALSRRVERLKRRRDSARDADYERRDEKYHKALRVLRSEKQRARVKLKRDILKRYQEEQPPVDIERQLTGKVVDGEVRGVLERSDYMTPEHLILIDAVLSLPPSSPEAELQRRITAIHAVKAYCGVEEGHAVPYGRFPSPCLNTKQTIALPVDHTSRQGASKARSPLPLELAVRLVRTEKIPKICFICLNNRVTRSFSSPGDLTKHFRRCHLDKFKPMDCRMCNVSLESQRDLLLHAEVAHGTVTRVAKYRMRPYSNLLC